MMRILCRNERKQRTRNEKWTKAGFRGEARWSGIHVSQIGAYEDLRNRKDEGNAFGSHAPPQFVTLGGANGGPRPLNLISNISRAQAAMLKGRWPLVSGHFRAGGAHPCQGPYRTLGERAYGRAHPSRRSTSLRAVCAECAAHAVYTVGALADAHFWPRHHRRLGRDVVLRPIGQQVVLHRLLKNKKQRPQVTFCLDSA